jgi:hypothetical protein
MSAFRAILLSLVAVSHAGCPLFFDADSVILRDAGTDGVVSNDLDDTDQDGPADVAIDADQPTDMPPPDADLADALADLVDDARAEDVATDAPTDMPIDLGPTGEPCPGEFADLPGDCNLVTQQPCASNEVCEVVFEFGDPYRRCTSRPSEATYEIPAGEPCSPTSQDHCEPHLVCRASLCVSYCQLDTGFGCEPGTFCASFEPDGALEGLGYCTDSCP